jgi:hypothetical protein
VDYNLNGSDNLFGKFNLRNDKTVNAENGNLPIQFPGDPLTALDTIPDRAWVIGETWTINSNSINQFTYGETRANEQLAIAFNGSGAFYELSFFGSFAGSSFATPYERQSAQGHVIPEPTFRDDVTLIRGKHSFQFGVEWNPAKVRSTLTNDFVFVREGLGGDITGLTPAFRPSDILPDSTAEGNWENFLLGDLGIIWNTQAGINYTHAGAALPPGSPATRDWRIYEMADYFEDSWRIRNDVTVTVGVRYQYQAPPHEVLGTEAQFFNTNVNSVIQTRISDGLDGISGPDAAPC